MCKYESDQKGLFCPALEPRLAQVTKSEQHAFGIFHAVLIKLKITSLDRLTTHFPDGTANVLNNHLVRRMGRILFCWQGTMKSLA